MASNRLTLTKRRLIEASGRKMFYWVAAAAVVVSFALVALQFIFRDFLFNAKVISAKNETSQTLNRNIETADALAEEVNKLLANENLAKNRSYATQDNFGVVVDALPVQATVTSLPAAIQNVIVPRSGVKLVSLTTPAETEDSQASSAGKATDITPTESIYSVEIAGNYDAIKVFIQLLERSIRPIYVDTIELTGTDASMRATIGLTTFHQSAKIFDLTEEVIRQ